MHVHHSHVMSAMPHEQKILGRLRCMGVQRAEKKHMCFSYDWRSWGNQGADLAKRPCFLLQSELASREHPALSQAFVPAWTQSCLTLLRPYGLQPVRQEYWRGLPFPIPGDLPHPEIETASLTSSVLAGRFFTTALSGKVMSQVLASNLVPFPCSPSLLTSGPKVKNVVRMCT